MTTLVLAAGLHAEIVRQALAALPRECCGLLEGARADGAFVATAAHPVPNLAADADRFELDPARHLAVSREARERGRSIIGCYHSHPDGAAAPSARDRAGADEADFVWLIAGQAGAFLAYLFDGKDFRPLEMAAEASLDPARDLRV